MSLKTKHKGKRQRKNFRKPIQLYYCSACQHYFSLKHSSQQHFPEAFKRKITQEHLEGTSLRTLARRHQHDKNILGRFIHDITAQVKDSFYLSQRFKPSWSGVLIVDGTSVKIYNQLSSKLKKLSSPERKALHRMMWLCGLDYGTGDLPHYDLADSENKVDLVMYFKQLKQNGYDLKVLVTDGNDLILSAARFVYGNNFLFQLCQRHFLEELRNYTATNEATSELTRTKELIYLIKEIISEPNLNIAGLFWSLLERKLTTFTTPTQYWILRQFHNKLNILTTYRLHSDIPMPNTTNEIENIFKQLKKRLKSMGRFMKIPYARDYLRAWALMRRFTPFTDCKKGRKYRNGQAPLTLAKCQISQQNWLNLPK